MHVPSYGEEAGEHIPAALLAVEQEASADRDDELRDDAIAEHPQPGAALGNRPAD